MWNSHPFNPSQEQSGQAAVLVWIPKPLSSPPSSEGHPLFAVEVMPWNVGILKARTDRERLRFFSASSEETESSLVVTFPHTGGMRGWEVTAVGRHCRCLDPSTSPCLLKVGFGGQDTDHGCMIFNLPLHVAFPQTTSKPEERRGTALSLTTYKLVKLEGPEARSLGTWFPCPCFSFPKQETSQETLTHFVTIFSPSSPWHLTGISKSRREMLLESNLCKSVPGILELKQGSSSLGRWVLKRLMGTSDYKTLGSKYPSNQGNR